MLKAGVGNGCAETREELFNSIGVQVLCDFVYSMVVEGMSDDDRADFDRNLDQCGDQERHEYERRLERYAQYKLMTENE